MKVKILEKKKLLDNFFRIDDVYLQFERFDGKWSNSVHRYNLDRGEAAGALIYLTDKQSFVFVRQFRYAVYSKGEKGWIDEIVAGVMEGDDTPLACIRRECIEEAGYQIDTFYPMGWFYVSPGITNERVHLFIGLCTSNFKKFSGGGLSEENEDLQLVEMPKDEALQRLKEGYFKDGKTLLALQFFFLNEDELLKYNRTINIK